MSVIYVCSQGAISASVIDVANVCMYVHCWIQLPVIGIELKMLPLMFAFVGGALACYSNFYTILMQGGIGKNGSTVAVSCWMFGTLYVICVLFI